MATRLTCVDARISGRPRATSWTPSDTGIDREARSKTPPTCSPAAPRWTEPCSTSSCGSGTAHRSGAQPARPPGVGFFGSFLHPSWLRWRTMGPATAGSTAPSIAALESITVSDTANVAPGALSPGWPTGFNRCPRDGRRGDLRGVTRQRWRRYRCDSGCPGRPLPLGECNAKRYRRTEDQEVGGVRRRCDAGVPGPGPRDGMARQLLAAQRRPAQAGGAQPTPPRTFRPRSRAQPARPARVAFRSVLCPPGRRDGQRWPGLCLGGRQRRGRPGI